MEVQEDSKCVGCGVKDWIIQDEDGMWCGDCVSIESADAIWMAIEASKKEPIFKLQIDEHGMKQYGKEEGKDE
jgi:ferredoxin